MSDTFIPQNALEQQLAGAQEGKIPAESFVATLVGSEVFMPIFEKHQIGGLQTQQSALPLKIKDEQGQEVLILFTSPERAKSYVRDFPGYGGGLVVDFNWILEQLGLGFGISLNPGCPVGIDFEATDVAQIAEMPRPN